jgi:hypothetical protein
MRTPTLKYLAATFAVALAQVLTAPAYADVLLDELNLAGTPSVAPPSEYSFTATTAQALTLTITDFQLPAAFSALQVAVTLGDSLVGSVSVSTGHTATLAIPSAAGNYTLHVIGTPDATQGLGAFGVCVAPATSAAACIAAYSFSGNIQAPATVSTTGTSTLNSNFTSTVAGTYTVTLTDDSFPVALKSVSAGIFQGSTPISVGIPPGAPTQVTLAANTSYGLLVAAIADASVLAGLYGIKVTDPIGATVFDRTLPVGTLPASTTVNITSMQTLGVTLTDFAYPAPLSGLGVAVTEGSTSLAQLTSPGTLNNFTAAAGTLEVWQYTVAGVLPGVYGLDLSSGSASLLSTTAVADPSAASMAQSYAFAVKLASAGTYNLVVNDFQFPSALQTLTATVAQNGALLQQTSTGDFTAVAGYVVVVVDAQPPQSGGNGIFGVTVQTSGASPQILLDQTQAVGGVFSTRTLSLGTSSDYDITLNDLAFPAAFQNLAVVLSRGSQVLGKIFGGGTFGFSGTPGEYVLTFVATPSMQNYGMYSIRIASSAPTVNFTAGSASVTAGQAVQLTWSTKDATACTASGSPAWTGNQPISGTTGVVISSSVTLSLMCSGSGGSASQSINVTATAAPAKSGGGGGGALDWGLLTALGVLVARRAARRHTPDSALHLPPGVPRRVARGASLSDQ